LAITFFYFLQTKIISVNIHTLLFNNQNTVACEALFLSIINFFDVKIIFDEK